MNQEKIGKLIAECRKNRKMTQAQLAERLGVTDKSVSKWENGVCLPDVSLYKDICQILGITLNEFFAGEKLSDDDFREAADKNLLSALENSAFTLKDRIDFFKSKWEKDHLFELLLTIIIIVFFIMYGFIKDNGIQYIAMAFGLITGAIENNRKMAYIESHAYGKNTDISIEEFRTSIKRLEEFKERMGQFESKKETIDYLMGQTGLSREECMKAYEFVTSVDFRKLRKM